MSQIFAHSGKEIERMPVNSTPRRMPVYSMEGYEECIVTADSLIIAEAITGGAEIKGIAEAITEGFKLVAEAILTEREQGAKNDSSE
jgi:hypothetical protein